jgi:hypothetical protein
MSGGKEPKLKEIVERHLPHEIDMLFAMFARLDEGISDIPLRNAAIESFCIHARNLIEFLEGTGKVKAKAVTYDYKAFADGKVDRGLVEKLHDQIAHLRPQYQATWDIEITAGGARFRPTTPSPKVAAK